MTDNLRIWDALCRTDPAATKNFQRHGGFKGTATKPIWITMRLTDQFGPCGVGWGMTEPQFQVVPAGDEVMVFCTVSLWYMDGDKRSDPVFGVGGDKVLIKQSSGLRTNDEAFKASFTDAISNCVKHIGVAADIHMGLFEDDKYVRELKQEFADEKRADSKSDPKPDQRPTASAAPPINAAADAIKALAGSLKDAIKKARSEDDIDMILTDIRFDEIKAASKPAYDHLMKVADTQRQIVTGNAP